ncbi:MAG TPA: hypothetical protein VJY62_05475 [Bacteroidia bacterium]|nr:hypothetical protein [Bacteroidia bacterium]
MKKNYCILLPLIFFMSLFSISANAQSVGIGTVVFAPLNMLDVKGAMVIGNTYSGVNTAPADGLLVEGNTGIGNATAPSLFSVGGAAEFRVNNAGDITRIRNVIYSWPAAQGAATSVLTNNGAGILSWQSPTATLYNESYFDYNTAGITVTTTAWQALPGMTRTMTLTAPAKLLCHTDGGIQTTSTATNGFSAVDIALFLNGAYFGQGGYERVSVVNNFGVVTVLGFWSKEVMIALPAGTYTVDVRANKNLGANANVGGNNTSVLQGVLITQVIYQ